MSRLDRVHGVRSGEEVWEIEGVIYPSHPTPKSCVLPPTNHGKSCSIPTPKILFYSHSCSTATHNPGLYPPQNPAACHYHSPCSSVSLFQPYSQFRFGSWTLHSLLRLVRGHPLRGFEVSVLWRFHNGQSRLLFSRPLCSSAFPCQFGALRVPLFRRGRVDSAKRRINRSRCRPHSLCHSIPATRVGFREQFQQSAPYAVHRIQASHLKSGKATGSLLPQRVGVFIVPKRSRLRGEGVDAAHPGH